MIPLNADLDGRLRNTELPRSKFLYPIFEAVVNSIYAIDDRRDFDHIFQYSTSLIEVKFIRESQTSLNDKEKPEIKEVVVSDNGIGFTNDNFASFLTLDSKFHNNKGCKGVGRLFWLKEFGYAVVSSSYMAGREKHFRSFKFTRKGVEDEKDWDAQEEDTIGSEIRLCAPKKSFKELFSKCSLERMSNMLFEHCLWFYLRKGGCPRIKLNDGDDEVDMDNLYGQYRIISKDQEDTFELCNQKFHVLHVKIKKSDDKNHVFYCAGNRVVRKEKINIVGLYDSPISDGEYSFYYQCYVTSDFLDDKVTSDRFSFMITESRDKNKSDDIFDDIVFDDIRNEVIAKVEQYLRTFISENIVQGERRMSDFVDTKAPYYKPLINALSEKERSINPNATDKAIDTYLHTKLYEQEHQLLEDGHDVLKVREHETDDEYQKRVDDYFNKAQTLKESDLARYVIHRKIIIELLEGILAIQNDGKYSKEDRVHEIIMPMRRTSDNVEFADNNLWLINDRLVFHHYLASDKSLNVMPITDSNSNDRPDIISETIYDNPIVVTEKDNPPFASFSIVEFKRPMRNDYKDGDKETDVITQCMEYVDNIRNSKVTDKHGRPLIFNEGMPAYCYIICDLTSKMKKLCNHNDFIETYDHMGYFGYKKNAQIYFEVISFNQQLHSAKERNVAFFEKLGLPHD